MPDGRSAYSHIRESYRKEVSQSELSPKEYEQWVDKVLAKETFQDTPMHISTLHDRVCSKIDIDPKVIADGKAIFHGIRGRNTKSDKTGKVVSRETDQQKDLSIDEVYEIPAKISDPDYIFQESNENFIFSYTMSGDKLARIIFKKPSETTSLKMVTYQKVSPEDLLNNKKLLKLYEK